MWAFPTLLVPSLPKILQWLLGNVTGCDDVTEACFIQYTSVLFICVLYCIAFFPHDNKRMFYHVAQNKQKSSFKELLVCMCLLDFSFLILLEYKTDYRITTKLVYVTELFFSLFWCKALLSFFKICVITVRYKNIFVLDM